MTAVCLLHRGAWRPPRWDRLFPGLAGSDPLIRGFKANDRSLCPCVARGGRPPPTPRMGAEEANTFHRWLPCSVQWPFPFPRGCAPKAQALATNTNAGLESSRWAQVVLPSRAWLAPCAPELRPSLEALGLQASTVVSCCLLSDFKCLLAESLSCCLQCPVRSGWGGFTPSLYGQRVFLGCI